jgi:anti-sigma regulatory factor (Ser/Thr protein kinase)
MTECYPTVPDSVPRARRTLARLALAYGAPAEQTDAVRLAVSEAMTNAVLRATGARGRIRVKASVAADELAVSIADDGPVATPRDPLGPHRPGLSASLGLALIATSTAELAIARPAAGGMELQMRFGLKGPSPWSEGTFSLRR